MAKAGYFGPELFDFLKELSRNNNREWFARNKTRWETDVRDPFLRFIADLGPHLKEISRNYVADPRPNGGSMMRIYRNLRFSRDKTPYNTMTAAHFGHAKGKGMAAPAYYIHLAPGEVFAGCGLWHPESATLAKIRDNIVASPARWKKAVSEAPFKQTWKLDGASLVRPPKGYDPEHPLIEDLKRTDFVGTANFTEKDACAASFVDRYAQACHRAAPFMRFLTEAVDLPW
jgi:uncharacterized protein (TIGR02453 family)